MKFNSQIAHQQIQNSKLWKKLSYIGKLNIEKNLDREILKAVATVDAELRNESKQVIKTKSPEIQATRLIIKTGKVKIQKQSNVRLSCPVDYQEYVNQCWLKAW